MITIRTKIGDTIEITEHSLWPEDGDDCHFFAFLNHIRVTGCLMLPHIYIPADSIAMITRDTRRTTEEKGEAIIN